MKPPLRYCQVVVKDNQGTTKGFLSESSVGPRIDFNVVRKTQTFAGGFSTAQIKIYNISDKTFAFLKKKGNEISLIAGNQNIEKASIGQLFNGYVYSTVRDKQGPDVVTIMYCSTVDPINSRTHLTFSKSYQSITLINLLKALASEMSMTITIDASDFKGITIGPKSFFNDGNAVLDEIARSYNFMWEVRGTEIVINKIGSNKVRVFEFSHASGLRKPPIITEKGVDIEVPLTPNINPGDKFILNAEFATYNLGALEFQDRITDKVALGTIKVLDDGRYVGNYWTLFLVHDGSTHTNQWATRIEGWVQSGTA